MKKILTILFLVSSLSFGQNGFYQLDFETAGGYTTSITELSDGYYDFFTRTDGSNIGSGYVVSGQQGSYYFAAEDIDGDQSTLPVELNITSIDISSQTGLQFSILIAEDDDGTNEDWDSANDYLHITYQIDGGSEQNLLWIENDGTTYNTAPQIDTDFDGIGDGATITSTFTEYVVSIPGVGTSLNLNFEFYLDAGDEDIAIDNIRLGSNETPLPVELTTFSASITENIVMLNWETATEVNNYGFDVERKPESGEWSKVAFVEGYGNSNSPKLYEFSDNSLTESGKYSYRLKQIDIDGKFEYSNEIEIDILAPVEYVLGQNYPNPFNPTTSIKFAIPFASNVKLNVYNVLGEEVATLLNENISAGEHIVNFNASELNSGIYFYQISAGKFTQIRKMMLIK